MWNYIYTRLLYVYIYTYDVSTFFIYIYSHINVWIMWRSLKNHWKVWTIISNVWQFRTEKKHHQPWGFAVSCCQTNPLLQTQSAKAGINSLCIQVFPPKYVRYVTVTSRIIVDVPPTATSYWPLPIFWIPWRNEGYHVDRKWQFYGERLVDVHPKQISGKITNMHTVHTLFVIKCLVQQIPHSSPSNVMKSDKHA